MFDTFFPCSSVFGDKNIRLVVLVILPLPGPPAEKDPPPPINIFSTQNAIKSSC